MKPIFLLLFLFSSIYGIAQNDKGITISVLKQSITVNLSDDNSEKKIVIHSNVKSSEKLKINNRQDDKEWKRTFEILDSEDQPVLKIPAANQTAYQVTIKQLKTSLGRGTYFLNTMAIPKDPKLAATVRVRRMLVCKIVVN